MSEVKMSAIDRALAAAKARKAAKEAAGITEETPSVQQEAPAKAPRVAKAAKEPKAERTVDPDREAKKAEREAARAAKKEAVAAELEAKRAARAAKKAEKAAARTEAANRPAHMKKVENARAKLPPLNQEAELVYNEIISNFGGTTVTAIAEHLKLYVRMSSTQRAMNGKPLEVGATVQVIGGDPKFIGKIGTVVSSQKLRTFVKIDGVKKDIYMFTTDLKVQEEQAQVAVAV
jgi:flagellar biosynthesis GTPase FlhF